MDDRRLREALGYRKHEGPPRVLAFETGYHVEADVRDAAAELGVAFASLPVRARGTGDGRFVAELLEALITFRPDFVLTVNHLGFDEGGVLAELLARYEIPTASWFVDHPRLIFPAAARQATPFVQLFCIEQTALVWLRAQGFVAPAHLMTASNARIFHPGRIDRARAAELAAPLVFVGHSWWSKAREEPDEEARARAASLAWPEVLPRDFVGERFADEVAAIAAPDEPSRMWAARVRVAESSLRSRASFATALAPLGLVVHGDDGWRHVVRAADGDGGGVVLKREVDPRVELPALFAKSTVNMNVTSDQLTTAVNQRVWDVPGAGGFLLTDAQDDALESFVEGESLAVFRGLDDAREKAAFYLSNAAARMRVVMGARRVVEERHRYKHRLASMVDVMKKRFG